MESNIHMNSWNTTRKGKVNIIGNQGHIFDITPKTTYLPGRGFPYCCKATVYKDTEDDGETHWNMLNFFCQNSTDWIPILLYIWRYYDGPSICWDGVLIWKKIYLQALIFLGFLEIDIQINDDNYELFFVLNLEA